jgi:hypothetical protein
VLESRLLENNLKVHIFTISHVNNSVRHNMRELISQYLSQRHQAHIEPSVRGHGGKENKNFSIISESLNHE